MWAAVLTTALGIWLMAAPDVLGYGEPAATSDRIVGPLIASLAMCAFAEVLRPMRWANLPLGLWLVAAPLALGFGGPAAINSVAVGLAVAALSFVRGRVRRDFAGGWAALLRREAPASGAPAGAPS